ncbi:MAG: sigma-54 interaction domain-containing protein [Syntrophobacteraceae bacterium]
MRGRQGPGKEIIAKAVHTHSNRIGKPFVSINCGAISKDLVESELFGYAKGTFTGQLAEGKKGKIEVAENGTLFLDEISELAPSAQVKLLRFLEEREFYPVGGTERKKVDVRIIAATNRSLEDEIKKGNFREDLYYRLNVVKIVLPPLRERKEDIVPLILFFVNKFNEKFGKNFHGISKEAEKSLQAYRWKGNVRELRNTIERVILMESGATIELENLSFLISHELPPSQAASSEIMLPPQGIDLEGLNKSLLVQALQRSGGNRTHAAKLLGLSRATVLYRIEKYGIKFAEAKSAALPA